MAVRFITERKGEPVSWSQFRDWVNGKGGFLSEVLEQDVHELWNMEGNTAYSIHWAQGLIPVGWDDHGVVWTYLPKVDKRERLLKSLSGREE